MNKNNIFRGFTIFFCGLILCGCEGTFSQKQKFESISATDVKWVDATIRLNEGDLFISGGAPQLMNARFDFLQPTHRPETKYEESGEKGVLYVQQTARSSVGEFSNPGDKNLWNILLNDAIPINLDVRMDRGKSILKLGQINSRRVNLECGEGIVLLDLLGPREKGMRVTIEGGTGLLEMVFPETTGVRIQFKEGSYDIAMADFIKKEEYVVNAAYGKSDVFIDVVISGHEGPIRLKSISPEE